MLRQVCWNVTARGPVRRFHRDTGTYLRILRHQSGISVGRTRSL